MRQLDTPSGCADMLSRTRRPVIGSGLPSWPETGLRYPRTLADAFPDECAGSISGPYRRPHRARHALAVALLALIAWGVIA